MRKGITGHTLVIVITLIVLMLGLVIFWLFITHTMEGAKEFVKEVSCNLCKSMSDMISFLPLVDCSGVCG